MHQCVQYSRSRFKETYAFASKDVSLTRGSFLEIQGIRTHHPRGQWWWYIRQKERPGQGIVGIKQDAGTRRESNCLLLNTTAQHGKYLMDTSNSPGDSCLPLGERTQNSPALLSTGAPFRHKHTIRRMADKPQTLNATTSSTYREELPAAPPPPWTCA